MAIPVSVDIDKPAADVFDLLVDARNEPNWNSQVSESQLVTAEPVGPDSEFRTVNRGRPYTTRFTSFSRPDQVTWEVTGDQMDITGEFRVVARGDRASHLDGSFDLRPKGFLKLIFPLMRPAIRKDMPRQFESFKAFAERH